MVSKYQYAIIKHAGYADVFAHVLTHLAPIKVICFAARYRISVRAYKA